MRQRLSDLLHRWAHVIDPAEQPGCACRIRAYMDGWRARRDAELRGIGLAKSPDDLDASFRRLIAASEQEAS